MIYTYSFGPGCPILPGTGAPSQRDPSLLCWQTRKLVLYCNFDVLSFRLLQDRDVSSLADDTARTEGPAPACPWSVVTLTSK